MNSGMWVLAGVIVGAISSGVVSHLLQKRQFGHDVRMFKLKNVGAENVKSLLTEMLSHKSYTDRSFDAMRKVVGGYTDDELRQFLHQIDAKRTTRNDGTEEWWYLVSRREERIANRQLAAK